MKSYFGTVIFILNMAAAFRHVLNLPTKFAVVSEVRSCGSILMIYSITL